MHVIPVEKEVQAERTSIDVEKISYWLQKYDGHLSAGICSCRASRAMLGEGCTDDEQDWCIQVGDMADYTVETGRAHYITKEEALEILRKAEENGYVHQITNIDGMDHIFDICNCNVQICNALRTSLLYNTPNMSKSSFTARVDKEKCVACGRCVELCPAGRTANPSNIPNPCCRTVSAGANTPGTRTTGIPPGSTPTGPVPLPARPLALPTCPYRGI